MTEMDFLEVLSAIQIEMGNKNKRKLIFLSLSHETANFQGGARVISSEILRFFQIGRRNISERMESAEDP